IQATVLHLIISGTVDVRATVAVPFFNWNVGMTRKHHLKLGTSTRGIITSFAKAMRSIRTRFGEREAGSENTGISRIVCELRNQLPAESGYSDRLLSTG